MQQFERLKQARLDKGFKSGTEAAHAMGVNVATYNAHENGHRGLTVKSAELYAKAFDVRSSWLLTGELPKKYMTPDEFEDADFSSDEREWGRFLRGRAYRGIVERILPEVDAFNTETDSHAPASLGVVADWGFPTDFAEHDLKAASASDLFIMKLPDDIMSDLGKAGDRVIVDAGQNAVKSSGFYVLKDADGHLHVRRITKLIVPENGRDLHLSTDTPPAGNLATQDQLRIVGRVIGTIAAV